MKTINEIQHSKNFLINGGEIDIETTDKEDLRTASINFSWKLGKFCLWFNGELMQTSKRLQGIIPRLKKLHKDWNLELA